MHFNIEKVCFDNIGAALYIFRQIYAVLYGLFNDMDKEELPRNSYSSIFIYVYMIFSFPILKKTDQTAKK